MPWASANTFAASRAFLRVNLRNGIFYMDSVMRTCFFALLTTDAADFTDFVRLGAFITVLTADNRLFFDRNKGNQMPRAGFYTHGTGLAACWLDSGHAIADADGIILTGPYTVTEP